MISKFKQFILSFTLFVFYSTAYAQTSSGAFEGEIIYANTYKSKNPKMKEQTLKAMLGGVHNYYIKNGNYKTVTDGMFAQWQLFINADNKLYNKMASSDTVFWNNVTEHYDELISSKVNKNALTVLGYMCDELILNCKSGVHKYYYNAQLKVNSNLFINHKYGNYYNYISRTNAVPLKMIVEDYDFTMESIATKVIPKKIPDNFFTLPVNTVTSKSLY